MKYFIAFIVAVAVVLGLVLLTGGDRSLGGSVHNTQETFDEGIAVDGTERISGTGIFKPLSLIVGGGSTIDLVKCTGATTWDPAAVTTTSIASATTSLTGAVLGDMLLSAVATSTQGLELTAYVSSDGVVTYQLSQPDIDAASLNIPTTTVQVCAIST